MPDRWIFHHAGTWPDIARGGPYDRPTWHYINNPVFLDGERPITANLATDPGQSAPDKYNCIQATKHCLDTIHGNAAPDAKALAYCWLFHLVGDMHQPLHAVSLYGDYFPEGDRGGNEIPLARGRNLHSLWDNLLGRDSRMRNVQRIVSQLQPMTVDAATPEVWIAESADLAKSAAYDPIILRAVREAKPGTELEPIILPASYMQEAGSIARQRVYTAGIRLAELLNSIAKESL
jgi:hypothetical protein